MKKFLEWLPLILVCIIILAIFCAIFLPMLIWLARESWALV